MKILVVEDDPVARRLVERSVQEFGHDVEAIDDGARAWARLQEVPPFDLVISDWLMPGVDGLELTRRIRAVTDRPYCYVLLLTARYARDDRLAATLAGVDDFMVKPVDKELLRARLGAAERIVRLERALAGRVAELEIVAADVESLRRRLAAREGADTPGGGGAESDPAS